MSVTVTSLPEVLPLSPTQERLVAAGRVEERGWEWSLPGASCRMGTLCLQCPLRSGFRSMALGSLHV